MRILFLASLLALAACVPTTKFNYVPVSKENFEAAQNGDKIPLIAYATAVCFPDGHIELLDHAEWTEDGICAQELGMSDEDDQVCYGRDEVAGIGIPYEGRSASIVPMASVDIGTCKPDTLNRQ